MHVNLNDPCSIKRRIKEINEGIRKVKKTTNSTKTIRHLLGQKQKLEITLDRLSYGLTISDHALVRFLRRAMKIETEKIRGDLLKTLAHINIGDGKYKLTEDLYAVVRDGVVVTFLNDKPEENIEDE